MAAQGSDAACLIGQLFLPLKLTMNNNAKTKVITSIKKIKKT